MPVNIDIILKLILGLIMFGVGLSLNIKDFDYIRKNKNLVLIGLIIKLLIIPCLAFLLLELSTLSLLFKFGTIIVLVTPGGTTSNVITYWFGGTSTLTILLTTLSSFICILSIPFFVNVFSWYYFEDAAHFSLPVWATFSNIFSIILLPSLAGLALHEKRPTVALKIEQTIKPMAIVLLATVYLVKFLAPENAGGSLINASEILALLPYLLFINVISLIIGFYLSKVLKKTIEIA